MPTQRVLFTFSVTKTYFERQGGKLSPCYFGLIFTVMSTVLSRSFKCYVNLPLFFFSGRTKFLIQCL
jgi:hypothetical protein